MFTISISYPTVIEELSRTAAYAGLKQADYDRLAVTQADGELLQSLCLEACHSMTKALRGLVQEVSATEQVYTMRLRTSAAFDTALEPSICGSLQSYVGLSVLARWLALSACPACRDYAAVASTMLDDAKRQLAQKKKPIRK